jgi:hypothetical protein
MDGIDVERWGACLESATDPDMDPDAACISRQNPFLHAPHLDRSICARDFKNSRLRGSGQRSGQPFQSFFFTP